MNTATHATLETLIAALPHIEAAPSDAGTLGLIVSRPEEAGRVVLSEGRLDDVVGLVGDNWKDRPSRRSADGLAHPDMQLNIISTRVAEVLAGTDEQRALAGDQLHVDLDLSAENLPPGTRLAIGEAVVEVTDQPHNGCLKFSQRFGKDALKFVNRPQTRHLNLRGVNAKVVRGGTIRPGNPVTKL